MESFGQDDEEMENCNGCPEFTFSCGIAGCKNLIRSNDYENR